MIDPAGWAYEPVADCDAMTARHSAECVALEVSGAALLSGLGSCEIEQEAIDEYRRRKAAAPALSGHLTVCDGRLVGHLAAPLTSEASPEPAHRDAYWAERHIAEQDAAIATWASRCAKLEAQLNDGAGVASRLADQVARLSERLSEYRDEITRRDDIIGGHDGVVASLQAELSGAQAEIARLRPVGRNDLAPMAGLRGTNTHAWWRDYGTDPRLGAQPYLPSED